MLPQRQYNQDLQGRSTAISTATFMSRVYLWMMFGILITGVISFYLSQSPDFHNFMTSDPARFKNIFLLLLIVQIVAVVMLSALINKMNAFVAGFIYIFYAALVGITFSVIFMAYTTESIASVFFLTSFSFAGLSAFGYITKRDLGPIGSFCMIGLFGLIGVMFLGFFIPALMSSGVQFATAVLGIVIFAGLTAYDTQNIKSYNLAGASADDTQKFAIHGALRLYLDFINLFLSLLRLLGNRR